MPDTPAVALPESWLPVTEYSDRQLMNALLVTLNSAATEYRVTHEIEDRVRPALIAKTSWLPDPDAAYNAALASVISFASLRYFVEKWEHTLTGFAAMKATNSNVLRAGLWEPSNDEDNYGAQAVNDDLARVGATPRSAADGTFAQTREEIMAGNITRHHAGRKPVLSLEAFLERHPEHEPASEDVRFEAAEAGRVEDIRARFESLTENLLTAQEKRAVAEYSNLRAYAAPHLAKRDEVAGRMRISVQRVGQLITAAQQKVEAADPFYGAAIRILCGEPVDDMAVAA